MSDDIPPFGRNLRRARDERGWSAAELSRQSGVSIDTIRALEGGKNANPQEKTLKPLAKALGKSVRELKIGWDEAQSSRKHDDPDLVPLAAPETLEQTFKILATPTRFRSRIREYRRTQGDLSDATVRSTVADLVTGYLSEEERQARAGASRGEPKPGR